MDILNIQNSNHDRNISMPTMHFHEHYEFYFLLSGHRNIYITSKVFSASGNTLCIIPPYYLHRTDGGDYKRINLNISENFLDENEKDFLIKNISNHAFILTDQQLSFIVELLTEASKIQEENEELQQRRLLPFAKTILYYLQTLDLTTLDTTNSNNTHQSSHNTISKVVLYLHQCYQEHITLDFLCKKFYISPNTLCKHFHAYTGHSIIEYVTFVRLEKVKLQLLSSNKSMEEIATLCGFSSANYMGIIFKKQFGLSPLNFRKNMSRLKV